MIFYVVTTEHNYTLETYVTSWGPAPASRMRLLFYEDLPQLRQLPVGTYIFSDLERLSPAQREMTTEVWEQLSQAGPRVRLFNHPGRVLRRYELLHTLYETGRNHFRITRATDSSNSHRFPVFVREENEHRGSLTPLLHDRAELNQALLRLMVQGYRLRDLLVVEFCDTSDAAGIFRKYSAFNVAGQILPRHLIFGRNWLLKRPDLADEDHAQEQLEYLEQNPHESWLREIFGVARVDYGRIDYAMLGGEPQVWEINTNPMVRRLADRLTAAFEAVDCDPSGDELIPIAIRPDVRRALEWEKKRNGDRLFSRILRGLTHKPLFQSLARILKPLVLRYAGLLVTAIRYWQESKPRHSTE